MDTNYLNIAATYTERMISFGEAYLLSSAEKHINEAVDWALKYGSVTEIAFVEKVRAVLLGMKNADVARVILNRSVAQLQSIGHKSAESDAHRSGARIAITEGNFPRARKHLDAGISLTGC